jgi:hypothetical protein
MRLWRAAQHCRQASEAREEGREREDASCYSPNWLLETCSPPAVAGYPWILGTRRAQGDGDVGATASCPGSVELALSVIKSNADERAKSLANQMLMEAMRKQAEDDGIVIDD